MIWRRQEEVFKLHYDPMNDNITLQPANKLLLWILSFLLVAFGQPVWGWWTGLIAAFCGYALLFRVLLSLPQKSDRFWVAAGWFAAVQMVQLSWMISHPFHYIYAALFLFTGLMGVQFGLLALFIQPSLFSRITNLLAVAGFWVVMEWSRLFFLSGFSLNPAGLALTSILYPLQMVSLGGVFFLSFWVILTNLFAVKVWLSGWKNAYIALWIGCALFPYAFGMAHVSHYEKKMAADNGTLSALLIQPAFPIEENMKFTSAEEARQMVIDEWKQIFHIASQGSEGPVDLVVLPEYVVPYGTFYPVFPLESAHSIIEDSFGENSKASLPPLEEPYAAKITTNNGPKWLVSNAFFGQFLANFFQADTLIGLEDIEELESGERAAYSAAFHFSPNNGGMDRYEKRVLVPLGEYIPMELIRSLAAKYGVTGSFQPGTSAKVFAGAKVPFAPSICYEETHGDLMCESRRLGAELLVNITNDGWFPSSRLPQQHFDLGRLRAVENGVPIVRACNTGVTGAVDSLGRIVGVLGKDLIDCQCRSEALRLELPTFHYQTLYSKTGDRLIVGLSAFFIMLALFRRKGQRT